MLGKVEPYSTKNDEQQNFIRLTNEKVTPPQLKKILLAEDDASVRRFLEVVLKRANYQIVAAEDGAIALQKAFESDFDLFIFDAVMPNLSGYDAARILRAHPNTKNVPLIILSGLEPQNDSNVDAHLLKNARLQEELLNAVERLLKIEN